MQLYLQITTEKLYDTGVTKSSLYVRKITKLLFSSLENAKTKTVVKFWVCWKLKAKIAQIGPITKWNCTKFQEIFKIAISYT